MEVKTFTDLLDALWVRKVSFLVTFFIVFLVSYGFLAWLDWLPEPEMADTPTSISNESGATVSTTTGVSNEASVVTAVVPQPVHKPESMVIDRLGRTITVMNPTSRTVTDLDAALLYGVVRHPDSATPERLGTVFILGHSSYLPTVLNPNFQAFNGIQNLQFGDIIRLQSGEVEYVYRVDRVYRAKAQEITVPIAGDKQRLVLATCNSFGAVDDRYIVEADFQEVRLATDLLTSR